jgi:hypothetical protein
MPGQHMEYRKHWNHFLFNRVINPFKLKRHEQKRNFRRIKKVSR